MSHRRPPLPPSMSLPHQWGRCRWCGQPILRPDGQPARLKWHPACVREFKLIHWPAFTRSAVFERDRGICARCGRDCELEERVARETLRLQQHLGRMLLLERFGTFACHWNTDARIDGRTPNDWLDRQLSEIRRERRWPSEGVAWWQADHVRPLLEAGGDLDFWRLPNLQTLCHDCHVQKGKEDNARRRAARDPQTVLL